MSFKQRLNKIFPKFYHTTETLLMAGMCIANTMSFLAQHNMSVQ